jgi:SAM-dependent methyltransferase
MMTSSVSEQATSNKACPCCSDLNFKHWMQVPERSQPGAAGYDLLRCPTCLHTWLDNRPTPDEMGYYYSDKYHRAIGHAGETSPKRWQRQLQVITKYKTSGRVLDIGCSSGGFLGYLMGGPWELYGIEASVPTAERARLVTGAQVFAGDVLDADFPSNWFDVITCSDVMEHLYEPGDVFRNVHKWLRPGGIFYVFVPNIMSWEARAFGSYWSGLDLPRHLHHYSTTSLARFAASAGLRQVRMVTPPGCYLEPSTAILVDHLVRKAGMKPKPLDVTAQPGLPWRIVRKGMRLSVEALYCVAAAACGSAPSLQAVFQKDA